MTDSLAHLFANNVAWSEWRVANDPGFFQRLAKQQAPRYLWIGCSDSRVPANEILGLDPGEVFVHRNVANVVAHSDLNCLSVLQFAIDVLRVEHIMVVGHYGCGGVHAVAENKSIGLADNWLRHVEDVALKHTHVLEHQPSPDARDARLVELNVVEQVGNLCRTTLVRAAWERGQSLEVHGLVFGLRDGLLRRLGSSVNAGDGWTPYYADALESIAGS